MDTKLNFLLLFLAIAFYVPSGAARAAVPAVYVFGDSTVDVGNNNFLKGMTGRANFRPYGIDFPGGRPTGRFSNGYTGVDYLVMQLGFSQSPPAYLSIKSPKQSARGINFASGGSGIFDTTNQNRTIPMSKQLQYFEEVSRSLKRRLGSKAAGRFLSKSIFYFSIGSNDIGQFSLLNPVQNQGQQDAFLRELTNQFENYMESLYDLGARKFLVSGVGVIGCLPILRQIDPQDGCFEFINNLVRQFNRATKISLLKIKTRLPGFSYSFLDSYDFIDILQSRPQDFGFTETKSACCGSGRLNAEGDCSPNATYCSNRDQYLYWDRFHVTQAFSKVVTRVVTQGLKYSSPITVKQLVQI